MHQSCTNNRYIVCGIFTRFCCLETKISILYAFSNPTENFTFCWKQAYHKLIIIKKRHVNRTFVKRLINKHISLCRPISPESLKRWLMGQPWFAKVSSVGLSLFKAFTRAILYRSTFKPQGLQCVVSASIINHPTGSMFYH